MPPTDEELLSDSELGRIVWAALQAFALDPGYFTDMCHQAAVIDYKRALWAARTNGTEPPPPLRIGRGGDDR